MKVVALAGGVGGAKLAYGLAKNLSPAELSIIVNTGDDFEYLGLYISPDVDTVCYSLADLNNPNTGWGRDHETWNFWDELSILTEGANWFHIGDKDLATHIMRTNLLRQGATLSDVTTIFCKRWNIRHFVYPMTNQRVRTIVSTAEFGNLGFQEYFVKNACRPTVKGISFDGIDQAEILPEAADALQNADRVVICPSNPWLSIDPIIKLKGVLDILKEKFVIAVSPIIHGKALKGPAAKIFFELGISPTASAVADHYRGFLDAFVIDQSEEASEVKQLERWGIMTLQTNIIMHDLNERKRLAAEILKFTN